MSTGIKQNGYILLPVVILISLLAVAAFMLNNESVLETRVAVSSADITRATYVADAGVQHAMWKIKQASCGPYSDIIDEAFGDHRYSATITPNNTGGTINTYTVAVSDDTWIREDLPTNNYGGETKLAVYKKWFASEDRHALYRFDLATSGIPAGAVVVSAVAKIFVITPDPSNAVSVHQVTVDWTEGAANWDNITADASSLASIPSNPPAGQFVDVNITSLVQGWLSGSVANQGILLKPYFLSNNKLSEYSSKDYGTASERPYLEIKVVDGSLSNRADINASGTLSNGVTRTVNRSDMRLYQPPSSIVWQPGADLEDTFIWSGVHKNKNFGISPILNIKDDRNVLIRFALEALPPGARISDAKLELYLESGSGVNDGVLDLHGINRFWEEGIEDDAPPTPEPGVTYERFDGSGFWLTSGGDYNVEVVDSITLPSMIPGWYEWNVTSQIQDWLDGTSNYGFLLREGGGDAGNINFVSSDNVTTPEYHPRLTVTIACECGVSCLLPQGSGNVLLVVGDAASPSVADVEKQVLFESWGYTITLIDDNADQLTFDTALTNNDVAYISETVWGPTLADKLANTNKGVVNEEEDQNSRLGLSSGGSTTVGNNMEIIDNSHYITALFSNSVLSIFNAPMEAMLVTGTPAADLQTLGNFSGTGSLSLVDQGGVLGGGKLGENAAGRRVSIPVGSSDKFNWNYLNNNGRLIVQRALQWGSNSNGSSSCTGGNYNDEFNAIAYDGDDGTLSWSNDWQELGESNGTSSGRVRVNASSYCAAGNCIRIGGDEVNINGRGLLREFDLSDAATAQLTFNYRRQILDDPGGSVDLSVSADGGANWTILESYLINTTDSSQISQSFDLTAYLAGNTQIRLLGSGEAGGYFRMDSVDIVTSCTLPPPSGGGGGSGGSCDGTYRDEFAAITFSGDDGTLTWAADWLEVGESDGADSGDVRILDDLSNYQLRIRDNNNGGEGMAREADLSGAATATLSFDYRRANLDNSDDYVTVYVSSTGTAGPWTELDVFGTNNDSTYQPYTKDISAYISTNTAIRLLSSPDMGKNDIVWFDNVQIECSP